MKHLKRIMTVMFAVMLMLTMFVPAFAADTDNPGSITLNGTTPGKEYRLYKIFNLTYVEGDTADDPKVSYTIAEDWKAFFETDGAVYLTDTKNNNPITVGNATKYIDITETNKAEFAKAALVYAAENEATKSVAAEGDTTVVSNLSLGYYLVYPVGATDIKPDWSSICSLTSTLPSAEVYIKAEYPTFTKTVDDLAIEGVQIGQELSYELKGAVPDTTGYTKYTYQFADTMTEGLTFNNNVTVTVAGNPLSVGYYTLAQNGNGFTLGIDILKMIADKVAAVGDEISVKYTATANEKGLTKIERNKAVLTYSNDPKTNTTDTYEQDVPVYTAKIVIDKYEDGKKDQKLSGAKFVLKDKDGKFYKYSAEKVEWVDTQDDATVVTTTDTGAAEFKGLKDGNYQLVEIEAPNGYNKLDKPVDVTIEKLSKEDIENNDAETLTTMLTVTEGIANSTGSLLPGTGGIGTTIFYVVGGLLMVGAVILFVAKKRMSVHQ